MNGRRFLAIASVVATVAGCAGAPANPDDVIVRPEPGRAVVVGWGRTTGEDLRAALNPAQGTRVTRLFVSKANEQKISGDNIARLAPGAYDLTIECGMYIDYRTFASDAVIHAELHENRVYRLRAEPQGRRCQPYLEEAKDGGK